MLRKRFSKGVFYLKSNRGDEETTMNLAEQMIAQLIEAGVERIYGVVGDSLNPIVDAVRASGGTSK